MKWFKNIVLVFGLSTVHAQAQSFVIPVDHQVPLLVKILMFDKQINQENSEYMIGVIYQKSVPESNIVKDAIMVTADSMHLTISNDIPVRFVPIDIDESGAWGDEIQENDVSALMVTPILKPLVKNVADYCRTKRIISMTTVPEYVDEGLAYSVTEQQGKQTILINLPVSISQGAKFSSQVLRIAKVLR